MQERIGWEGCLYLGAVGIVAGISYGLMTFGSGGAAMPKIKQYFNRTPVLEETVRPATDVVRPFKAEAYRKGGWINVEKAGRPGRSD